MSGDVAQEIAQAPLYQQVLFVMFIYAVLALIACGGAMPFYLLGRLLSRQWRKWQ